MRSANIQSAYSLRIFPSRFVLPFLATIALFACAEGGPTETEIRDALIASLVDQGLRGKQYFQQHNIKVKKQNCVAAIGGRYRCEYEITNVLQKFNHGSEMVAATKLFERRGAAWALISEQ